MKFLDRFHGWYVAGLLALVVFLVYGNALFNHFVWDDGYLIVNNPYIKDFRSLPNLFSGDLVQSTTMRDIASGYYRPLSMLWFMADYHIWGLNPFGFHVTNVLIHFVNVLLVYLLVLKVSKEKTVALWTGLLFAVHPIHVEAVTPIYNRMGIQTAMFMLSSLVCFVYAEKFQKGPLLAAALGFLAAALFSKEEAVVLPVLFVVYDYLFWRRGSLLGSGHASFPRKGLLSEQDMTLKDFQRIYGIKRSRIIFYLSCGLIGLSYLSLRAANVDYRFLSTNTENLWGMTLAKNWFWHLLTTVKIGMLYVTKIIWLSSPSPVYWIDPVKSMAESLVVIGVLGLLVLILAGWRWRNRRPVELFFISFFLITLLPFSNILPIAEVYTFRERFAYLPALSICFGIVALYFFIYHSSPVPNNSKRLWFMVLLFMVFSWGTKTIEANYAWRNNLTLWRYAVAQDPQDQLAHLNLGDTYMTMGRSEEALVEFNKSLGTPRPKALSSIYLTRLNIAAILIEQKQFEAAREQLRQAMVITNQIKLNPASVYDKLGLLSVHLNDPAGAEENFRRAIFYNENSPTSRYNLAVLYYSQRRYPETREHLVLAMADKDFIEAHYLFGLTLLADGHAEQAKKIFEQIVGRSPGFKPAIKQLEQLKRGGDVTRH